MRKKRNMRKTIKQRGGMFSFFKKPLTPEKQLEKDALEVLKKNNITDLNAFLFGDKFVLNKDGQFNDVIFGDYTFRLSRGMSRVYILTVFKTSNPTLTAKLYSFSDY